MLYGHRNHNHKISAEFLNLNCISISKLLGKSMKNSSMSKITVDGEEMDIYKKKLNALDYFKNRLLNSEVKDMIAEIILFGSVASGEATPDSDIDVLVFTFGDLRKVSYACAEASLWTGIETKESVEPLVYCIDDLRYINSYFIYNAIKKGKEVYKMDEKELIRGEVKGYSELAKSYYQTFKRLIAEKDFRVAVDVGYNAVELCVKGLLLLKMEDIPRTHGGVVQKFGELYVKPKLIAEDIGRLLNIALENRNKARYDYHAKITKEDAEEIEHLTTTLIKVLEREIELK